MKSKTITQGSRKMANYLAHLTTDPKFKLDIQTLRIKYKIPIYGYDLKVWKRWPENEDPSLPPREWFTLNFKKINDLYSDLDTIQLKYEMTEDLFEYILFEYFFFNLSTRSLTRYVATNTCKLRDLINEKNITKKIMDSKWSKVWEKGLKNSIDTFPISISISPYASINDIRDFILKNKNLILEFQAKYKKAHSKIGHQRMRITSKRNQYIMKNIDKPRPKIAELVTKKFGVKIDAIGVRNIISRELKRIK